MMQVLLFLLLLTFTYSFVFLPKKIQNKSKSKSKTQINCYFYNEDYPSDCENNENKNPIFIVIWKDTKKTENLLFEMRKQGLNTVFIPENTFDTFQLTTDDMPLVYKDDILLEDWVDIYTEMYPM
jgi:adenine-specific DNA methylase